MIQSSSVIPPKSSHRMDVSRVFSIVEALLLTFTLASGSFHVCAQKDFGSFHLVFVVGYGFVFTSDDGPPY